MVLFVLSIESVVYFLRRYIDCLISYTQNLGRLIVTGIFVSTANCPLVPISATQQRSGLAYSSLKSLNCLKARAKRKNYDEFSERAQLYAGMYIALQY